MGLAAVLAFGILMAAGASQAAEMPGDFLNAASIVPGLVVEIRYASYYNFVGRPPTATTLRAACSPHRADSPYY